MSYKQGDKVVFVGDYGSIKAGDVGTVSGKLFSNGCGPTLCSVFDIGKERRQATCFLNRIKLLKERVVEL